MKSSSGPGCDTGIGTLGRIPWGSHFCNFYRAQSDLAECVVPFFQKAFVDNEMGIWITSDGGARADAAQSFPAVGLLG